MEEDIFLHTDKFSPCYRHKVIVKIAPMGKPRMTQHDRWKKRPAVLRYHAFKDSLRVQLACHSFERATVLSWTAYISMPKSWSKKKKAELQGKPHLQKPDRDNIDKAIMDAILKEDKSIYFGTICKLWDDGKGERIELSWG